MCMISQNHMHKYWVSSYKLCVGRMQATMNKMVSTQLNCWLYQRGVPDLPFFNSKYQSGWEHAITDVR
jgi:hypothetical protein